MKANPAKTMIAHSASPGYLPKIAGNKDGNLREANPSAMTAATHASSHNLLRDVSVDVNGTALQLVCVDDKSLVLSDFVVQRPTFGEGETTWPSTCC